MLTLCRRSLLPSLPSSTNVVALDIKRQASLTGAISRGIRKSQDTFRAPPRRREDDDRREGSYNSRFVARSDEGFQDERPQYSRGDGGRQRPATTTREVTFREQRRRDDYNSRSDAKPSPYRQRREARLRQHFAKGEEGGRSSSGRFAGDREQETASEHPGQGENRAWSNSRPIVYGHRRAAGSRPPWTRQDERPTRSSYGTRKPDGSSGRSRDRDEMWRDKADDHFDDLDSRGTIGTGPGTRRFPSTSESTEDREFVQSKRFEEQPYRTYGKSPKESKDLLHKEEGRKKKKTGEEKWEPRKEQAENADGARGGSFGQRGIVAPRSIPYTTAGSEFLYGTFAVKAAIQAGRRKLHKLYIWRGEDTTGDTGTHESPVGIHKLALAAGVRVSKVEGLSWNTLLLKMSNQRPHNGFVLEAAPLPRIPVTSLSAMEAPSADLQAVLAHQTAEQLEANRAFAMGDGVAKIDRVDGKRYPLILFLDRIVDPGNLGAIIRSAYYLGVDAMVVLEFGTSPFSAVTLKASAGAAEYLPILTVKNEHKFIKDSKQNGWKFFAAVAPGSAVPPTKSGTAHVQSALATAPSVLLVGSEGEGLRPQLVRLADGVVSLPSGRSQTRDVDSLNVSVAAALLAQEFLKSPDSHHASTPVQIVSQREEDAVESAEKVF